jgi:hypothetical protein
VNGTSDEGVDAMLPLRDPPCREDTSGKEAEVVELAVLLHAEDLAALEEAACRHGLTPGQVIRRLIREFLGPGAERPPRRAEPAVFRAPPRSGR